MVTRILKWTRLTLSGAQFSAFIGCVRRKPEAAVGSSSLGQKTDREGMGGLKNRV